MMTKARSTAIPPMSDDVRYGSKADICSALADLSALGQSRTLLVDYHVDAVEQRRGYS